MSKHPRCDGTSKTLCRYNCQYCYNLSFASSDRSKFWSPDNTDNPRSLFLYSKYIGKFICDKCDHDFTCSLSNITNNGNWCPYCTSNNRKLCQNPKCKQCHERSFASHPKAEFWSSKNKETPRDVSKSSSKKFWFECLGCLHEFDIALYDCTARGYWCPYCAPSTKKLCSEPRCIICFNRSFASHPKAMFWSKENNISPREIPKNSHVKYKFDCTKCNHTFISRLETVSKGSWCNYCNGKLLCDDDKCKTCYDASFASHHRAKNWSSKNILSSRQIRKNSNKKYWFDCSVCKHSFETILDNVVRNNSWCPYCTKSTRKLCDDEGCTYCHERSFASHSKSKFWSKDNSVTAREVTKNSHAIYLFNCIECNHTFSSSPLNISKGDQWCGYCNGHLLCKDEECEFCYNASFASHYRAEYWMEKNELTARQVRKSSNKKYWFECPTCSHEFEGCLDNIFKNDSWCPYCCFPTRALCEDLECDHCFNNSFASSSRAVHWSKTNKEAPRDVFINSHNKYTFVCGDCKHKFDSAPNAITTGGTWCPVCKKKTEKKMYEWLLANFPNLSVEREKRFDWCANPETSRQLPFDFYLQSLNLIVEIDGPQHFRQVLNWESPEDISVRDRYKEACATCHGISIIRLLQEDVLKDDNKWEAHLKEVLNDFECEEGNIYSIYDGNIEIMSYDEL